MRYAFESTVLVLLLAALLACSGDNPIRMTGGSLNIYLTDAPIDLDGVSAVNVTISSLTVFPVCEDDTEDCEGIVLDLIPPEGQDGVTLNLLDYRDGQVILLASETVEEGEYRRIRMEIARAWLVIDDDLDAATPDIEEEITVPSGKVEVVVPFYISAGDEMEIILDFDAAQSIHLNLTGNNTYLLRPVINASTR